MHKFNVFTYICIKYMYCAYKIRVYLYMHEVGTVYMHIYTYVYILTGECFKYPCKRRGDTNNNRLPLSGGRGRNAVGVTLFTVLS